MNGTATATPLWTAAEVAAATGGRAHGGADWHAQGVSIDTRTLAPGDLFIALRGENGDGHDFVAAAFDKGAAAALVSRVPAGLRPGSPLVDVADTQKAMEALGQAARARGAARFVAVTGSVGKTSTKEALRHALSAQGPTSASAASYNNAIGVPLTLARIPREARYAVLEIGMNHRGETAPLSLQVRPHVAVITMIGSAHLENLGSVAAIADEKADVFAGMSGGAAVLNRDNAYFFRLAELAQARGVERVIGFGRHGEAQMRLLDCTLDSAGSELRVAWQGREIAYRVGAPGEHWALNSLAVLAAADALGADPVRAAQSLADIRPMAGRGARTTLRLAQGSLELIDDSYNASPVSMRAAFAVLGAIAPGPGGRRIAVLGDMRELGDDAPALHAGLAEPLREAGIDLVFACGTLMENLVRRLPAAIVGAHAPDSASLAPLVAAALRAGDVVTVKGSLGSKMRTIVEAIRAIAVASGGRP